MRALAEFIMASRIRAVLVVVLSYPLHMLLGPLYIVSPAVVGLVVLRQSLNEGCLIALWVVLPLAILANADSMNVGMVWPSILPVILVLVAAKTLAQTRAWTSTLLVITGLGLVCGLMIKSVLAAEVSAMREALNDMLRQLQQQGNTLIFEPSDLFIVGLLA